MLFRETELTSEEKLLHARAQKAVKDFQNSHAELLEVVSLADRARLFEKFGLSSTFRYCVDKLGLSEPMTSAFIRVARVAETVPAVAELVKDGICISKVKKVAPIITLANQEVWAKNVRELTYDGLERAIAKEFPKMAVRELVTPVAEDRVRVQLGLDEASLGMLKKAQALLNASTLEETLEVLLVGFLQREDPEQKALRAKKRTVDLDTENIPAPIANQVSLRDRSSCQAKLPNGKICGERRWTEIHHIRPRSEGGDHSLGNLITLCGAHHRLLHRRSDTVRTNGKRPVDKDRSGPYH